MASKAGALNSIHRSGLREAPRLRADCVSTEAENPSTQVPAKGAMTDDVLARDDKSPMADTIAAEVDAADLF